MSFDQLRDALTDLVANDMVLILTLAIRMGGWVHFFSGDVCDRAGRALQYWRERAARAAKARRA